MSKTVDINSTERYDLDPNDISFDDLFIIAEYGGKPEIKFKPLSTIRNAWQTQNYLYMAAVQTREALNRIGNL